MKLLILVTATYIFINSTNAGKSIFIEKRINTNHFIAMPLDTTKPDAGFLNKLEKDAKQLADKPPKNLTKDENDFLILLKTATNASTWNATQYATFAKKTLLLSKSAGVIAREDPDSGGKIYSSDQATPQIIITFIGNLLKKSPGSISSFVKPFN
jgi:hypothetical protein